MTIQKIDAAFAWTQQELNAKKDRWLVEITSDYQSEIDIALVKALRSGAKPETMSKADFELGAFGERLADIQNDLETDVGVSMIRGLDINNYDEDDLPVLFAGISSHLGTLLTQSTQHEKIGLVADGGDKLATSNARGTRTKDQLPFHTDRSDVIGLICVRAAEQGGESYVVSAGALHNKIADLRPDLLEVLYQPFYHRRTQWEANQDTPVYSMPVFSVHNGQFAVRYLRHFIRTAQEIDSTPRLTDAQNEALDLVDELCMHEDLLWRLPFAPGDMQYINNFVVLHGRGAYSDSAEPGRKLLRSWLSVPNSRALAPSFSPIYGNTDAGQVRGGVAEAAAA